MKKTSGALPIVHFCLEMNAALPTWTASVLAARALDFCRSDHIPNDQQLVTKHVWSTNRYILLTFFSTFNMDRRTDQKAYFPLEMQFYISVMFLGFPDEMQEEKPSFLDSKNNWLRTDRRTNRRTNRPTDGRTDPLIEMRGRI